MILGAIKGRAQLVGLGIGLAAFVGMGFLIWALHAGNQRLTADNQRLELTAAEQEESARNHLAVADALHDDIKTLDDIAGQALAYRAKADEKLNAARQALHEALKDNQCAHEPHPAAVGDWLRKHSDDL